MGSIPSSSVSLIRLSNPIGWGNVPLTYSDSWPWKSFGEFRRCAYVDVCAEVEFKHLGVSVRGIAQRFSDSHPGSKTKVQAFLNLWEPEIRAVQEGETPWYKERLEQELGNHVDFELILVAYTEDDDDSDSLFGPDLRDPDTDLELIASCITIR